MPPPRFVFDTNIYRYGASSPDFGDRVAKSWAPVSVSAVVLSELWRSTRGGKSAELVEDIERRGRRFVFAPTETDWRIVGQYLATRLPPGNKKPSAEVLAAIRKEQNDALIAVSAWRRGHVLVTCDKDFEPIRSYVRAPEEMLVTLPAPP